MATIGTVKLNLSIDTTPLEVMRQYHLKQTENIEKAISELKRVDQEQGDGDSRQANM